MPSPTLSPSKLRPPVLPGATIARPQLLQLLREAAEQDCLLSLLSAPLGYGKSTLLAHYVAGLNTPWGWLRCDAGDNRPLALLLHLHQAVGLAQPERALAPGDEERLWASIVARLEQHSAGFTLILDDLHQLRAGSACRYLETLLRHPPAGLHLLAASEGLPHLALGHLRRDRRLQVLDTRHLALDSNEIQALAAARDQALGNNMPYCLRANSEGWISGVLLELAAHEERPQAQLQSAALRTDQALVAQFFEEEVLRPLPPDLRRFLESLSVVNACDARLAACLSGRTDCEELLRRMLRQGLFIQQCGVDGLQYRLHSQLRQTLYHGLQRRAPEKLEQLHRQAADWLLQQHCYAEATYQLGRARDFNALLAAIDRHSFDLLREGKIDAMVDLLTDVPGQNIEDHFTLAITEASTLIVTNDIKRAAQCLVRLQRLLRNQAIPPRRAERAHQTLGFLRSRLAFLGGNFAHGIALVDQTLQHYAKVNAATAVLLFNRACCQYALGRLHEARRDAEQALAEIEALNFSGYINLLHLHLGLIELAQGELIRADERFAALAQVVPTGISHDFYDLFEHLGKGIVLLQQHQLPQAARRLAQAEAIALGFPHCSGLPWVLHYQALCLSAQGDLPGARARWEETRRLARTFKLFALYRQASAWRARLAVSERDQDFILGWLQEWHWCNRRYDGRLSPDEWLAYAWVQRHLGQYATTRRIAGELRVQATAEDNQQLSIDLHLLEATLYLDEADRKAALHSLDAALRLAARHGPGQLLQLEGRELSELFRQLISPPVRRQFGLELPLPPREQITELLRGLAVHSPSAQPLPEPLTRREQDVLRRMASGQANQQISDGLYISLSTVKTHINNLFRKLDATDREGALQAARKLKLLD